MSDRKSTRLNSSHLVISYAVFCLKKKKKKKSNTHTTQHRWRQADYERVPVSSSLSHYATVHVFGLSLHHLFVFFFFFFFLMIRRPPNSPLFPYTPLFR